MTHISSRTFTPVLVARLNSSRWPCGSYAHAIAQMVSRLLEQVARLLEIVVVVLEVGIVENLVGGRDVGDRRHGESVKAEIDHPLLVDRVRDRAQEADVGEPAVLRIGHAVVDVMIGVAIEGEEQRAGVDADFLERDAELLLLVARDRRLPRGAASKRRSVRRESAGTGRCRRARSAASRRAAAAAARPFRRASSSPDCD